MALLVLRICETKSSKGALRSEGTSACSVITLVKNCCPMVWKRAPQDGDTAAYYAPSLVEDRCSSVRLTRFPVDSTSLCGPNSDNLLSRSCTDSCEWNMTYCPSQQVFDWCYHPMYMIEQSMMGSQTTEKSAYEERSAQKYLLFRNLYDSSRNRHDDNRRRRCYRLPPRVEWIESSCREKHWYRLCERPSRTRWTYRSMRTMLNFEKQVRKSTVSFALLPERLDNIERHSHAVIALLPATSERHQLLFRNKCQRPRCTAPSTMKLHHLALQDDCLAVVDLAKARVSPLERQSTRHRKT